jgi:hypothetical protein
VVAIACSLALLSWLACPCCDEAKRDNNYTQQKALETRIELEVTARVQAQLQAAVGQLRHSMSAQHLQSGQPQPYYPAQQFVMQAVPLPVNHALHAAAPYAQAWQPQQPQPPTPVNASLLSQPDQRQSDEYENDEAEGRTPY